MRFMVMVPASKDSESGVLPSAKELATMGKFNEELVKAGVMLAGEGLQPTSKGARLTFDGGGKTTVKDGPFSESKELIAGFWMIEVKSKEEALAWMRKAPFPPGMTLEIRQVFDVADFAPSDPTGELRANEARLRNEIASKK